MLVRERAGLRIMLKMKILTSKNKGNDVTDVYDAIYVADGNNFPPYEIDDCFNCKKRQWISVRISGDESRFTLFLVSSNRQDMGDPSKNQTRFSW